MKRIVELRRLAPFAALASAELAGLAAAARSGRYAAGAPVFWAGEPCDSVILVVDGFVRLSRLAADGAEVTTGIIGPGGFAAVATLRGRMEHDDAATALSRVRTIELPATIFLDLANRSPGLFTDFIGGLVVRLDDAYIGAVTDAQGPLAARILHTLRCFARPTRSGSADARRPLAVRLTHAEVARLVGAERATVTRLIGSLAGQGLVHQQRGHITGVALAAADDAKRAGGVLGRRTVAG